MMKKRFLLFVLLSMSLGCALKHPDSTPVTPYEKVILANATLAQTNNSIARGVIQLQATNPPVLSATTTERILRIQASIAADDNKLTLILDQGPTVAKVQAAQIQSLITAISQEVDLGIQDGSLGVKNPTSQQTFTTDLGLIKDLSQQIVNTLKVAGVLQ